jgi:hypothetical protein
MDIKTLNGSLGEISAIKRLIAEHWDVFIPITGKTEFDIIAYRKDLGVKTIQVKSCTQKSSSGAYIVEIKSVRSNKTENTIYKFDNTLQDILAIYIVELDSIVFLTSSSIKTTSKLTIGALDAINKSENTLQEILGD